MRIVIVLLAGVSIAGLVHAQDEPAYMRPGADGRSWAVGNGLVEREIRFVPDQGLLTTSWRHTLTGTDFIKPWLNEKVPAAEFSFSADDKALKGASTTAQFLLGKSDSRDIPRQGKVLEVRLEGKSAPVEVSVFYAVYRGHPVVRKWLAITNRGTAPLRISRLAMEELDLRAGTPSEQEVSGFYGVQPREIFFTGRVEDTAIVSRNTRSGEGFVVMNEAPGWTKRTEMDHWGYGVRVRYDLDVFPFERTLPPGESFTTAASGIAFFKDGTGFADPHWVMPTYTSQVLLKKGAAYDPPWVFNTWEPFGSGINATVTHDLIAAASRMGLDVFAIDDGWQAERGENAVSTERFPRGLDEILAAVERGGMRLGLWVPLAVVSQSTAAYRQHPEWVSIDMHGRSKFAGSAPGGLALMCLATPYREVAAKRINELIGRYHLKYVKIDLGTVLDAYGLAPPGCYAQGHDHHTWAESLERTYEGIQYLTERIYGEHPDVLLDLTFELWGQKHVIDYGLLAAGDLDWLSNVRDDAPESAGPRQARTLLYHRSLAIPAEAMLIGNLQANTPPIEERLATGMGSGPVFLGDLRKLAPAEQDWYAERIRWFKKLRREVPINEGFFPLGAWEQPSAATWDGFARLSRRGEGLIAIFKNQSGVESVELKLPVFPEGSFRIRSWTNGGSLGTFSGEQFRRGIHIRLPARLKAELLEIRK